MTLERGSVDARWVARDLPSIPLPPITELTRIPSARHTPHYAQHPLIHGGITALLGIPLELPTGPAALWLGRDHGVFDERDEAALVRSARLLERVLAQPDGRDESAVYRRFIALMAMPAVYIHEEQVFINRAAETLTGFHASELDSLEHWFAALYGEDAATMRAMYELDRQHSIDLSRITTLRRKDGVERMVELATRRDGTHEVWLLHDVTERVNSQERFRVLFEQTGTALSLYDESGIIDCNPAAVALLGYATRGDLLHKRPETLSAPLQRDARTSADALPQMENIALTQGSHRFDWLFKTRHGADVPVEVTLTPLMLGSRRVLLAEWHDISERLRYQAGLEAARDSALAFARARSDFLATMSHEIRTPMNGVIGMTRLLSETTLDSQQREYVDTVRACGEGLLALINDILDFSRLEAGKVQLERIPLSVREVAEDAISVLGPQAHGRGLELVCRITPEVPSLVWGDPTRLRQVLLNLISNAVKFTTRGTVEVTVHIVPGTNLSSHSVPEDAAAQAVLGPRLRVEVRDTGVGIAPEAISRLFTAFSQEDSSTTRRFGGSGLGLAICKRLTELMRGTISVSSGPGGSRFSLSLPLETHTERVSRPSLAGFRVALLEDRRASRAALLGQLSLTGVEVVEDAQRADLVIVEQGHAGGSGIDIVQSLVQSGKRAALLRRLDGTVIEEMGAAFVLPTPVREHALHQQLARVLLAQTEKRSSGVAYRSFAARVLVAEDNPVNQRVVVGLLRKLGCEVEIATDGLKAVEACARGGFDLVFMDCQMPNLDGFEATRRIRSTQAKRLPIIALTAGVMVEDRERCLSAGMDAFLVKPVRLEDLDRTLAEFLPTAVRGE
ncbi:MAG: response regulator [Archangium sp.]|nr:response regulator [Archangium sp.]